jgi:hypothetical protein
MYMFDASDSSAVPAALSSLREMAAVGIQTVYFGVADTFSIAPLELIAEKIMPEVAEL